MNKIAISTILGVVLFQATAFAVPASTSYMITAQVGDMGGGTSESASYMLLGKARDYLPATPSTGISYTLGEGFLRSIFYGPILPPFVLTIAPNSGTNDKRVFVTIAGGNFLPTPTYTTSVELQLAGEPSIVGSNVYATNTTITCVLDLTGSRADPNWVVKVVNSGLVPSGPVLNFRINAVGLKTLGPSLNFPNPFNPDRGPTVIKYILTQDSDIILNLYTIQGEKVWSKKFPSGSEGGKVGLNQILWDGRNVFDASVPNGVYVLQISTSKGKTLDIVKIAVLR